MKKFKLKKIFRPDWTIENARNRNLLWLDKNESTDDYLSKNLENIEKVDRINYSSYPDLAKLYKKLAKKLKINQEYHVNRRI